MNIILCGNFTKGQKKPCKWCKHFLLWGIGTGYCGKTGMDMMSWDHCKYYKRASDTWFKSGKCKVDENELYC